MTHSHEPLGDALALLPGDLPRYSKLHGVEVLVGTKAPGTHDERRADLRAAGAALALSLGQLAELGLYGVELGLLTYVANADELRAAPKLCSCEPCGQARQEYLDAFEAAGEAAGGYLLHVGCLPGAGRDEAPAPGTGGYL